MIEDDEKKLQHNLKFFSFSHEIGESEQSLINSWLGAAPLKGKGSKLAKYIIIIRSNSNAISIMQLEKA